MFISNVSTLPVNVKSLLYKMTMSALFKLMILQNTSPSKPLNGISRNFVVNLMDELNKFTEYALNYQEISYLTGCERVIYLVKGCSLYKLKRGRVNLNPLPFN